MNRLLLIVFNLVVALQVLAQTNTLSPYSIYGLGDAPDGTLSSQAGMGNASLAFLSVQNINLNNPATLTYISKPSFNFDFRNELLSLSSSGASQVNNLVSIENFSFAFPIINNPVRKRQSALSFGIKPYTRQGYNVLALDDVTGIGAVEYRFIGQGGINSGFFGWGFDLIADSNRVNVLSIGAVGSYVFGTIYRNRITMVDSSSALSGSNIFREERNEISAADVRLGLLYTRKVSWQKGTEQEAFGSFSLGAYVQPSVALNTASSTFVYSFEGDFNTPGLIDSIDYNTSKSPTTSPLSYGLGFGFTYENRWNVAVDLIQTKWSQLAVAGIPSGLNDETRIAAGFEHIPDPTSYKQLSKIIRYRAGVSYALTRLNVNGIQPTRFTLSGGLGIPVIASRSTSIFNLGIEYARRGANGLPVTENYLNAYIGMTITPNQFDRWFAKRKYD
jgi:hypothetical protein